MDRFAFIEELNQISNENLTFYSVSFEGDENNEFEKFLNKFSKDETVSNELGILKGWINKIKNTGAKEYLFNRKEERAEALPPRGSYLDVNYHRQLRLYCCRISDRVVFLFNGGIKTKNKAQDCPNVGPKFREANELVKAIDEKIKDKEIYLNDDDFLIVKDKELSL